MTKPKLTFKVSPDSDSTCVHVDLSRQMDRFEQLAVCAAIESALIAQLGMRQTPPSPRS